MTLVRAFFAVGLIAMLPVHCASTATGAEDGVQRPNILIILADDMGYGDLGCMGSQQIRTPAIDEMRAAGVLCTQAYVASSVCSPSRAGLLTGRDPRRFGYEGNLNAKAANYATRPELLGLPPGEHTLADHLKSASYQTALIGKWHLGTGQGFHPNDRGFDHFCGMLTGSHNYFPTAQKHQLERNRKPLTNFSSPYLTDFFTDEAIRWIDSSHAQKQDSPWFMFLSYNAPHTPMQATEADMAACAHIADSKRRTYAAMMLALDRGVSRVRSHLKNSGQLDNTLICFFSDNGGATNNRSWNGPLSGVKGCLREGGIRVPMIWSWPDQLPANTTSAAVVSSLDLLPTFMAAAKSPPLPLSPVRSHEDKGNRRKAVKKFGEYDGRDLLPVFKGKTEAKSRTLFWRLQGQTSVLSGDDKLITLSHRPPQLFSPATDQGETIDRFDTDRPRATQLFQMLGEWESLLPTVPLWGSSPYWSSQSARHYDDWGVREEGKPN